MKALLDIVRAKLSAKAISIAELAVACNCSRAYIYKMLRQDSQPTVPMAERLAAAVDAEITVKRRRPKKNSKKRKNYS